MAVTAQGTTLKFTPQGGEQVTVGKVVSIGEIGGDSQIGRASCRERV